MADIGNVALMLAMVFSAYAVIASLVGVYSKRPILIKSGQNAAIATFLMLLLAAISLWQILLSSDLSNLYAANNTNRDLSIFYKFAALWGGQAGSLLLWSLLLAVFMTITIFQYRHKHPDFMPYVIAVMAGTTLFFTLLHNFASNPFQELAITMMDGGAEPFVPQDGRGLNPLLQHPAMVIHPPILYIGYVGFIVPFAFAIAALATRQLGPHWLKSIRRWTLTAWFFLGIGILLGGKWAYVELGWGGYWAWDPVENASLMPWLTGTAFLHSVIIQERKGMLKVWNMVLIIMTYFLCVFGTFLTRSGVVSSVHAFAQSSIGNYFAVYLVILLTGSVGLLFTRLKDLQSDNKLDSMVSRESSFLFNNLVFLAAAFAVLWGTTFPILSEWVQGEKISVGQPFFNKVNIPIGLLLLFLMGVGPLLAWRKNSFDSLKKSFAGPVITAIIGGILLFTFGIRDPYALVSLTLCVFVTATIVSEFYKGAKARTRTMGENFGQALINLTLKNTRRYGGYIVHFAVVLLVVGFTGNAFNEEHQIELAIGEAFETKGYTLTCVDIMRRDTPNYITDEAKLELSRNGKVLDIMLPERRFYKASEQPTTEVEIYSSFKEDFYVSFVGKNQANNKAVIDIYINPLVIWVWIGGLMLAFGSIVAMFPNKRIRQEPAAMILPSDQSTYTAN